MRFSKVLNPCFMQAASAVEKSTESWEEHSVLRVTYPLPAARPLPLLLQLRLLSEFELREPAGMRTEDRALVVAAVTPTLKVVTAAMEYIISKVFCYHIHLKH
jgi:hypothetical protein